MNLVGKSNILDLSFTFFTKKYNYKISITPNTTTVLIGSSRIIPFDTTLATT